MWCFFVFFNSLLTGQASRQVAVRHASGVSREFHAKYGLPLLIAGATFCTAVWSYVGIHVAPNYTFS